MQRQGVGVGEMYPSGVELRDAPLARVAAACREETAKFLRRAASDDVFCFELLRRAVCDRNDAAWAAALGNYRGLVLAWVRQHPATPSTHEPDDHWVTCAFERFWLAVRPERFGQFVSLAALLKYLKLCVHSVLLDEARRRAAAPSEPLDTTDGGTAAAAGATTNAESLAAERLSAGELWQAIVAELAGEQERLVAYGSFVLDLKPADLYARSPERFDGVADVYRIKRNLIERLRRSPAIQEFLK